jgi:hypothetical protein
MCFVNCDESDNGWGEGFYLLREEDLVRLCSHDMGTKETE